MGAPRKSKSDDAICALIERLIKLGVSEFEGVGIKVKLYPGGREEREYEPEQRSAKEAVKDALAEAKRAMEEEEMDTFWSAS